MTYNINLEKRIYLKLLKPFTIPEFEQSTLQYPINILHEFSNEKMEETIEE